MKPPTFRKKVAVSIDAARRVWKMAGTNSLPMIVEAETLKSLHLEDEGFRLLDGGSLDLKPWKHSRMQDVAFSLYRHNHMAGALLGIIIDFVWGDGISVVAKHEDEAVQEEVQGLIDEFWEDPINAMDRLGDQRILELFLWGEICMPVLVNEETGAIRVGWIDAKVIEDVKSEPVYGRPATVIITDSAAEDVGAKELEIIRYIPDQDDWVGSCFFYTVNSLMSSHRGVSELYSAADWLDVLDATLKAHSDRAKLDSHFIWDVLLEGFSDSQIQEWYKKHGKAPKPNSVRAHNEKVKWQAVSPNLGSADMAEHIRTLKTYIMGGFRYPNHWYASGDDANLATASVMAEPTRKALKKKQKVIKGMLTDMVRYSLRMRQIRQNVLAAVDLMSETPFDVLIPDLSGPDIAKVGAAIVAVTNAILAAVQGGLVSEETAQEVFALITSETGIEIDPAAERDKIENERESREEAERKENEVKIAELNAEMRGGGDGDAGADVGGVAI